MSEFLLSWVHAFWFILLESGIWLILGFALAGAVHALLPAGLVQRQLSGKGLKPIVKASLLGIPLPLCSCSVIPVAAGLRRSGASRGASAAFAISTPQTGEESIPLTWALFGPVFAVARPIVAVLTALIAGLAIEKLGGEHEATGEAEACSHCGPKETPKPVKSCCSSGTTAPAKSCCSTETTSPKKSCCSTSPERERGDTTPGGCCDHTESGPGAGASGSSKGEHEHHKHHHDNGANVTHTHETFADRVIRAFRHGFITMPVDLAPWLTVGLILAGLISAAVPEHWIAEHVGTGILPMLAMLLVGIPLYICATSSTPLAFSLVAAGLSPGAALVLLLAGPATNVATISWAIKDLGVRSTVIYLITIAAVSLACGLAFDALFSGMITLATEGMTHEMSTNPLFQGGAVSLLLLLGVALAVRVSETFGPMLTARHAHG